MPCYEYRHVVGFEETSLVGNVYFTNYFLWQGHCRESFLRERCPQVLGLLTRREVAFFTRSSTCDYVGDWGFSALDEVLVRMRLAKLRGGRMQLAFEYVNASAPSIVVATGAQEVHCKARNGTTWVARPFPSPMARALLDYAEGDELRAALRDVLAFEAQDPPGAGSP